MAQDPNEATQAADDAQADASQTATKSGVESTKDKIGMAFSSLIQAAKDKKTEISEKLEKIDAETSDITILIGKALTELANYEKKLNSLTDATEGKLNFLKQFATAKGVIFVHSWKAGVGLIGAAYGRGLLMAKGDAGWSLPLAITKPEIKLGPQVATIEEDQIILLSNEKTVMEYVNGKTPSLTVGIDAFLAFGDKGGAIGTDDTTVAAKDQKGFGGGGTVDFGTYMEFPAANEKFYGKDCDKKRILTVSPDMDSSDLVKSLGDDKLAPIKEFITTLEGFIRSAQDELAKVKK